MLGRFVYQSGKLCRYLAPINLVLSGGLFVLWIKGKPFTQPVLFGGYTIIKIILLGIFLSCSWEMFVIFWKRQDAGLRYVWTGIIVLLVTIMYCQSLIKINQGEDEHLVLLAQAFSNHQVSLVQQPSPALLALPDPYDPAMNGGIKIHDALLYKGKYYIYSGPIPSILILLFNKCCNIKQTYNFVMLFFVSLFALVVFLLVYHIWRNMYPNVAWHIALLCYTTVLWSFPVMWQVARPAYYETSITGGQSFLLVGIYCLMLAFSKIDRKESRKIDGSTKYGTLVNLNFNIAKQINFHKYKQNALLVAASCAFGLAIGTRWNLVIAVIAISILPLFICFNRYLNHKKWFSYFVAYFAPLLIFATIYGYYNFIRFDSPLNFGLKYQLPAVKVSELTQFSLRYLTNNIILYGVLPPADLIKDYPVLTFASWSELSDKIFNVYGISPSAKLRYTFVEPFTALCWVTPTVLIIVWPLSDLLSTLLRQKKYSLTLFVNWMEHNKRFYEVVLMLACFGGIAPLLVFLGVTMRYHMDYFPALGLLSVIGILRLCSLKLNIISVQVFICFLSVYSIVVGVIASVTGYYNKFSQIKPETVSHIGTLIKIISEAVGM